jgi:hypothetical protein
MRFLYLPPNSQAMRERLRLEAHFEQFWSAFRDQHESLAASLKAPGRTDALATFMHKHLPMSANELEWEFGPAPDGGYKLVFSIYPHHTYRAVCDRLVELAPTMDGWSFAGYRQPEPPSVAGELLTGRRGVPLGETWFKIELFRGQCVAITCFASAVSGRATELQAASANLLVEILVGEQTFENWVGPITLLPIPKSGFIFKKSARPSGTVGIDSLKSAVDAAISALAERLPNTTRANSSEREDVLVRLNELDGETVPRGEDGRAMIGCTLQRDPEQVPEQDDYAERDDLLFASTIEMPLLRATSGHFHSRRFSRVGETFCYLKLSRALWTDVLPPRADLEDALSANLQQRGLGVSWGGATGRRYSYIELALTHVSNAIDVIRHTISMSQHKIDAGWLLFHDVTLRDEYVDIATDQDLRPPARKA